MCIGLESVLRVSILGLARNPTVKQALQEYRNECFNTWAREEPNLSTILTTRKITVSILGLARNPTEILCYFYGIDYRVSILGLARNPTRDDAGDSPRIEFQYLGSRGTQLTS